MKCINDPEEPHGNINVENAEIIFMVKPQYVYYTQKNVDGKKDILHADFFVQEIQTDK